MLLFESAVLILIVIVIVIVIFIVTRGNCFVYIVVRFCELN